MKASYQTSLFSAILLILGIFVFGQTYQYQFVKYDDPAYITENKYINGGVTLDSLKWAILRQESGGPLKFDGVNNLYHPLTFISHMIDVQLFGLNAGAHHLMNVFIHLVSTLFAFLFIKSLTRSHWTAFIASALFLLHPTHVESVAWLSERKDTLSGLFFWMTLYYYVSRENHKIAFICLILGLLSKPSIIVLPCIIVLIACSRTVNKFSLLAIFQQSKKHWHWFAAALFFATINLYTQSSGSHAFFSSNSSFMERISIAGTGYWFYLYRTLFPVNLSIAYNVPNIGYYHYVSLFAVLLLCCGIWKYRNKFPDLFIAISWFTICWLPVSGVTYLAVDFTVDRYLYLSLGGFFILIAKLLSRTNLGKEGNIRKAAALLIILVCTYLSFNQTKVWQNTYTLFKHATIAQPNSIIGWTNLGAYYQTQKNYKQAVVCHNKAISLNPQSYISHHNLGVCNMSFNDREKARVHFKNALDIYPAYYPSLYSLAKSIKSKSELLELSRRIDNAIKITKTDERILTLKQDIERHKANLNKIEDY